MNGPDPKPLRRITTITLCGDSYDLAINGDHYHLVEHKEPDAYLRPVARKVELNAWLGEHSTPFAEARVQALLDLLGERESTVLVLEAELERVHTALQREAEPGASSRRPIARESGAGLPNVLEENGFKP